MEEFPLSDVEQRMTDDLYWARTAPEVQRHQGKLVVVRNRRVVAIGTDPATLLAQAAVHENCPEEELLIVPVPRADLQEIPH